MFSLSSNPVESSNPIEYSNPVEDPNPIGQSLSESPQPDSESIQASMKEVDDKFNDLISEISAFANYVSTQEGKIDSREEFRDNIGIVPWHPNIQPYQDTVIGRAFAIKEKISNLYQRNFTLPSSDQIIVKSKSLVQMLNDAFNTYRHSLSRGERSNINVFSIGLGDQT